MNLVSVSFSVGVVFSTPVSVLGSPLNLIAIDLARYYSVCKE